jgi:predicted transposase YdaD
VKRNASPSASAKPTRDRSDTLCKRLAEEYPAQFAEWLFGAGGKVKVEKTELSREPIRADSVIFSRGENETLHIEFQTTTKSNVPLPLRLLDYYVGLKRKNPQRRVRQVLVVLKPTGETIPDRYVDELTVHRYHVVKLWEQDPAVLLKHEGLLPLATLCRAESGEKLLGEVAARIKRIKSREQRREMLNWSRMLAGLRYTPNFVYQHLKESDMLEESSVYQDILQKGERRGEQRGVQKGERRFAMLLLEERFGKLAPQTRKQIERLSAGQLEELGKALLHFKKLAELNAWLKQNA